MSSFVVNSYKDLKYWQMGMALVLEIYQATKNFPATENYGLTSQIRRAAVSIPANIAEGYRRGSRKEYRLFLTYSFGSGAEVETYLELCLGLKYFSQEQHDSLSNKLNQILRMLNAAIQKL